MCLILLSHKTTPGYPLVLLANRDEFFARPTASLSFWEKHRDILAGRDLQEGGTWLGVHRSGRFAAITNYREPQLPLPGARTRGEIVTDFLLSQERWEDFSKQLNEKNRKYRGFNLLGGSADAIHYYSNRAEMAEELKPGIHGLSNALINDCWPKVERGKLLLERCLLERGVDVEELFHILQDRRQPLDDDLPSTGVGQEWERMLAPLFITSEIYGTRTSALITMDDQGNIEFQERTFYHGKDGIIMVDKQEFTLQVSLH